MASLNLDTKWVFQPKKGLPLCVLPFLQLGAKPLNTGKIFTSDFSFTSAAAIAIRIVEVRLGTFYPSASQLRGFFSLLHQAWRQQFWKIMRLPTQLSLTVMSNPLGPGYLSTPKEQEGPQSSPDKKPSPQVATILLLRKSILNSYHMMFVFLKVIWERSTLPHRKRVTRIVVLRWPQYYFEKAQSILNSYHSVLVFLSYMGCFLPLRKRVTRSIEMWPPLLLWKLRASSAYTIRYYAKLHGLLPSPQEASKSPLVATVLLLNLFYRVFLRLHWSHCSLPSGSM